MKHRVGGIRFDGARAGGRREKFGRRVSAAGDVIGEKLGFARCLRESADPSTATVYKIAATRLLQTAFFGERSLKHGHRTPFEK